MFLLFHTGSAVKSRYLYNTIHFTVINYYLQKPKSNSGPTEKVMYYNFFLFQGQDKHIRINSIYDNSAFVTSEELEMPKDENEIHYGQIDFSTPQTKSTTVKGSEQETIYAEVCGSGKD